MIFKTAYRFLLGGLLSVLPAVLFGQKVADPAYDKMLAELLSHSVPEISVGELVAMEYPVLLDARSIEEYNVSHIPGAMWVGYETFDLAKLDSVEKSTPIVVYCSVGYRSEIIAEKLIHADFKNVANLYGGIFEWVNENHTVVEPGGDSTEKIHAYDRNWGVWLHRGDKIY